MGCASLQRMGSCTCRLICYACQLGPHSILHARPQHDETVLVRHSLFASWAQQILLERTK